MQSSKLLTLFENELKEIFWIEKALIKATPKMIQLSRSIELIEELLTLLEDSHHHVNRLAQVFAIIYKKPVAKKCTAIEGLIKEAVEIMELCEAGAMCDAGIISAGQKVQHYKIATYGTLRQFAETLGLNEAATLLAATLEEEKAADKMLSKLATTGINIELTEIEA